MILYGHIQERISNGLIRTPDNLKRLFYDFADTVKVADELLADTKNFNAHSNICKLVNVVFFEFLQDRDGLLMDNTVDGVKITPKIHDIVNHIVTDGSERDDMFKIIILLREIVGDVVVISENDGSAGKNILDRYANNMKTIHNILSVDQ